MSKPDLVPSRSIEVTSSSPAPSSDRAHGPGDRVEARGLPAALDHDLEAGRERGVAVRRRAARRSRPPRPASRTGPRTRVTSAGSATARVLRPTLSAPARSTSRMSSTDAHAAADGQRDERPPRGPLDDVEQRPAALGRGGDVEEHELVGALAGVALGELGRVALVDEVEEAGALDDAAVGDVEARDHAAPEHQAALPAAARAASATTFATRRRPSSPERSGWNWTPSSRPRATADTNRVAVLRLGERRRRRRAGGSPTYEWTK